jgi:hypothetical protein
MLNTQDITYCTDLVRQTNRDFFLQSLFLKPAQREKALVIGALDAELRHVHAAVNEEMLGHIRYAWWKESIESIYNGQPRAHPVITSLASLKDEVTQDSLLKLVSLYQDTYPGWPENSSPCIEELVSPLVDVQLQAWQKAGNVITKHRQKHQAANGLLALKLMVDSLK